MTPHSSTLAVSDGPAPMSIRLLRAGAVVAMLALPSVARADPPGAHDLSPVAALFIGLALLAAVLLFWTRTLHRRVAEKTAELTRSLEALQQAKYTTDISRDRLAATLDVIPDLLFEVDLEGRYLDVHATRVDRLVAPAEQLLGRTVRDVLPAEAAAIVLDALRSADRQGWSGGQQIMLPLPSGPTWFELSVARKQSVAGQPPTFIVLSRDITDRHHTEVEVQRLSCLYAALSQSNQAIVRCTSQAELMQHICRATVIFGGMRMAWIGLLDDADGLVKPVAAYGNGTEYVEGLRISLDRDDPTGRGPTGTALREDRPFWCQDYCNDPATAPWHERGSRFGWAASAALPLHREGGVVGSLNLYAGEVNAFDQRARDLLLEMAMDIDFALERFRRDAERARMVEALAESERKYRELTESVNDVIWTLDPETLHFTYVSPSISRLRGYTADEVMAQPFDAVLTPESALRVRALITARMGEFLSGRAGGGEATVTEVEQPCKDGSTVWTEVVANVSRNPRTGRVEIRGVTRDITERRRAAAQIQHFAHFDQLTGLPNRTLLKDRFANALSLARRSQGQLAVLFIDLDHFKDINDTLGHETGDLLLIEIAHRLGTLLRAGDTVARLGGDEFILILPDTDANGTMRVVTKLLEEVSRPCVVGQHELRTSASVGIAMYPDDGTTMDTLSKNADAAMYQVKRDSRNDFRFFTPQMQARSARMLMLSTALHSALERDQLSLHYQPQVSLPDGRVTGAEALLRWQHPELGAILPAEFIPIAESNGLIAPIGEWVLSTAVSQMRRWMDSGLPPVVIAVNLSAVQFRKPTLPELVSRILREAGLPPDLLELELTEAVAMNEPQTAVRVMDSLSERGIRMSIDDFGIGYSSLSYLKRFKVQRLKIDQSFVRDINTDPDDRAIVIAIINLAHSLGMRTIAEGVETPAQLDVLQRQGCDEAQGYHFSRPLPADAFEALMRSRAADATGAGPSVLPAMPK